MIWGPKQTENREKNRYKSEIPSSLVFAQTFLSKQNGYQSKSYPTKYKLINKPLYNFQKCKRLIWYLQIKPPTEEAKLGGEAHRIGSIDIENSRSGNGIGRPRESERRWNNSGNDSFHVFQSWKRKSETQNLKNEANPERVDEFTGLSDSGWADKLEHITSPLTFLGSRPG